MRVSVYIILTALVLSGCQPKHVSTEVKHAGALHDIMSGKIGAVAQLDTLERSENLMALGAVANLQGEIQIFEGRALVSSVGNNGIQIVEGFEPEAALLVYAEVADWIEVRIPDSVGDMPALEEFILTQAQEYGINAENPFPFRLQGIVAGLDWHVIDWDKDDAVHSHKKHKEAGFRGELRDQWVEIIGFFSKHHRGIFTHRNSTLHMHFRVEEDSLAGHVDELELERGEIRLLLPKS